MISCCGKSKFRTANLYNSALKKKNRTVSLLSAVKKVYDKFWYDYSDAPAHNFFY